jgi:hypothetical protein
MDLFKVLKRLPTDYSNYGGEVKRWEHDDVPYPDCSCGCKFFVNLTEPYFFDWGVCAKPEGPRAGLLTWEHQAGFGCFEQEDNDD